MTFSCHLRCVLLLPLWLLSACSSGNQEKQTPSVMSQRMADRIAASRRRMGDPNDRSVFDKAMQSSISKGKDTGGWLGRQKYSSNTYTDTRSYTNTGRFQTSGFSQADTRNSMARQGFAQSDKTSSSADDHFQTGQNRLAGRSARDGNQTFAGADDAFKTTSNRDALRSQEKNDRPKFIVPEENFRKSAYTEDQVRHLLGRD